MAPVLSFPRRAENQEGQPIGKGKSGEGKPPAWGRMDLSSLTPPQSPPWSQRGTSRLAEQILPP